MKKLKKKTHEFVLNHDYIKLFVIFYVLMSVVLAVFLGLFYFLMWILIHIVMEIYKRWHLFEKFDWEDFLIVLQHCKIDLLFLFLVIGIETLSHHPFAVAGGRLTRIIEAEAELVATESRIVSILKALPRILGMTKAAKGTAKIAEELLEHKKVKEEKHFRLKKSDVITLIISLISILTPFLILKLKGYHTIEIIEMYLHTLQP